MRRPPEITQFPRFPVTGGTILLAVGVTLAYWSNSFDASPLLEDGNVRRGQLWRLVTSALPHGTAMHLVFNLYWTWVFGTLVEQTFGHLRTLALFLLLALGSGAAEYALMDGGIGLSGVGYGLFGMLWVLARRDPRFADAVDANTTSLFAIWFVICIVLDWTGAMAVANVAHGAGAVLGGLLGTAISGPRRRRALAAAATTALLLAAVLGATVVRPRVNLSRTGWHHEFRLGYAALESGRNEEAARWLRDVVRMKADEAPAWFNLAIAYARLDHPDQSLAAYKRAHDLAPNDPSYKKAWEDMSEYVAATRPTATTRPSSPATPWP